MRSVSENIANTALENASPKKKILWGAVLGYVALGVSILSSLFFTPWIKNEIGIELYGIYTLAISILNLFLLDFGLSSTINAYVSRFRAQGKIADEDRFLSATLKLYLFIDVLILIAFVVFGLLIDYVYVGLSAQERDVLKVVFVILAAASLITFPTAIFNGVLSAYEEFAPAKIVEVLHKIVYVVLTVIALAFKWGIYAIVAAYAISSLVNSLALYLLVRFRLKKKIRLSIKTSLSECKDIASFSIYAFVITLASRLMITIAPSVLGIVSDSTGIAVFGIASPLEGYMYSFSAVMNGFFMPQLARISEIDPKDQATKIQGLAIKVGRIQLCLFLLVFIGFVSVGEDFIFVWLKEDPVFAPAYVCAVILSSSQLFVVPFTIYRTALMRYRNSIRELALVEFLASVVNVGLLFGLGYLWGVYGVCAAILISMALKAAGSLYLFKSRLGVSLWEFFAKVCVGFGPATLACLGVGLGLRYGVSLGSVWRLLITGVAVVLVFMATAWIGFGASETRALLEKIGVGKVFRSLERMLCLRNSGSFRWSVPALVLGVAAVGIFSVALIGVYYYPDITYISSPDDLFKIAADLNGHFVFLGSDVMELPEGWTPIGTKERPFRGTIDGKGVTLQGADENSVIAVGDEGNCYFGFIGYNEGTIRNIAIYASGYEVEIPSEVDTCAEFSFGQIAAYNMGTIENVVVQFGGGTMSFHGTAESTFIGQVAGVVDGGTVRNCWGNRSINVEWEGDVSIGLAGSLRNGGLMERCTNDGNVTLNSNDSSLATIGGVVGECVDSTIRDSKAARAYRSDGKAYIGGIAGISDGSFISDCFAEVIANGGEESILGGVVGEAKDTEVYSCVSSFSATGQPSVQVGQIAGTADEDCVVTGNFYTREVDGASVTGGTYSSLPSLSLASLGWDEGIWMRDEDGGFYLNGHIH